MPTFDLYGYPRPVVAACTGHAVAMGAYILLAGSLMATDQLVVGVAITTCLPREARAKASAWCA